LNSKVASISGVVVPLAADDAYTLSPAIAGAEPLPLMATYTLDPGSAVKLNPSGLAVPKGVVTFVR
jgi:hypothetical protein